MSSGFLQVRSGYWVALVTLVCAVILSAAGAGAFTYVKHRRDASEHVRLVAAEMALARLELPDGITAGDRSHCSSTPAGICASSDATPLALLPALTRLVHGTPDDLACRLARSHRAACGVMVVGRLHGYPVLISASPHILVVQDGDPPRGAVRAGLTNPHLYALGSDVVIELRTPGAPAIVSRT
jgi:hypothetical protein